MRDSRSGGLELAADLRMALDPVRFARSLGFERLDPWQVPALQWAGRRLLLNVHRQGGKSTVAAILALHQALYWPGSLVLLVSPSLRQSVELFRKVADLLGKLPIPPKLLEDNRTSFTLKTGSRVVSLPSSESTIRGYSRASLIIEDEASRVDDALHYTIRPMLAVSGGRLILMATPFGQRGHFWEAWASGGDLWERVEAKATDCPRITPEFLAEERATLGDWWFRQEYLCAFAEPEGHVFQRELLEQAVSSDVLPFRWQTASPHLMMTGRAP